MADNEGTKAETTLAKRTLIKSKFKFLFFIPIFVVGAAAAFFGSIYLYVNSGRFVSTENAYVKADKITVSAGISGRVVAVDISDNEEIKSGDTLFRISREAINIALKRADARLASAKHTIVALKAEYRQKVAERNEVEGDLRFHTRRAIRQRKLFRKGFSSQRELDDAEQELRASKGRISAINQNLAQIQARLGGNIRIKPNDHPAVQEALAAREAVMFDLRRADVRSPVDGIVTNFGLQVGEYIQAGAPVFSIVGNKGIWVEANYKETDLTNVRVGQKAKLNIDTYPDVTFHARVVSIAPATGAEFALLPPQNASGNWVKVVQRLPVRVELLKDYKGPPVRVGMSVSVEIDTDFKRELPRIFSQAMAWVNKP